MFRHIVDPFHPRHHIEDLTATIELLANGAAHRLLIQNFTLAIGIKVLFLTVAILGKATLWMAVFADVGASLLVVFNGLRLIRFSGEK